MYAKVFTYDLAARTVKSVVKPFKGYPRGGADKHTVELVVPETGDYDYIVGSYSVTPVVKTVGHEVCEGCFTPRSKGWTCFTCEFWGGVAADRATVVVDGAAYSIGPENEQFKGFGGRAFRVKYRNGKVRETSNLWYRGEVPPSHRAVLKDNAKFLNP